MTRLTRREAVPLAALAAILLISAAWWALALWPLPADSPEWLQRTRLICFGSARDTLPTAAGWTLLIGEPVAMLTALATIWRDDLVDGLRGLWLSRPGRRVVVSAAAAVTLGLAAASGRVWAGTRGARFDPAVGSPDDVPRLDLPAPPLDLVDQHGARLTVEAFHGRPLIVAFAYAHCTTICPLLVHDALEAQRRLAGLHAAVIIVTLDPWRDTPDRLPTMAEAWHLGPDAYVASGDTTAVQKTLDAWKVPRSRDMQTGDVTHPALIYLLDGAGRIRYAVPGNPDLIEALAARL
jgi:protein SCO1/2